MSSVAENLFFYVQPPTRAGDDPKHQVISTATATSAANWDWVTALGADAPQGSVMVTIESLTTDCYVRFKPGTEAAATTSSNGLIIVAGQPGRSFYVDPVRHGKIDVIAPAGAGTIKLQVSSPLGTRNRQ